MFMTSLIIVTCTIALFAPRPCVAQSTLKLATINSPPYCDETLPDGGVYTTITREAFRRTGYTLDIYFLPWKRAFEMTKNGNYDGLMLVSYKEERIQSLHYTDSILKEEGVLFSQKGRNITYTKLEDLSPYIIGVMRGSMLAELLLSKNLKVEEVTTHEQNIQKLIGRERIDLIASQKLSLLGIINAQFPEWKDKIEIVMPPVHVGYLHNVISRNNPNHETIVKDFNIGLQKIKSDGTFTKILEKHGFEKN